MCLVSDRLTHDKREAHSTGVRTLQTGLQKRVPPLSDSDGIVVSVRLWQNCSTQDKYVYKSVRQEKRKKIQRVNIGKKSCKGTLRN